MEPTRSCFSMLVLTQDEQALRRSSREERMLRVSGVFQTLVRHGLCGGLLAGHLLFHLPLPCTLGYRRHVGNNRVIAIVCLRYLASRLRQCSTAAVYGGTFWCPRNISAHTHLSLHRRLRVRHNRSLSNATVLPTALTASLHLQKNKIWIYVSLMSHPPRLKHACKFPDKPQVRSKSLKGSGKYFVISHC